MNAPHWLRAWFRESIIGMGIGAIESMGTTMAGEPDAEPKPSSPPSRRRIADDGVTIEEWDPGQGPTLAEVLKRRK